MIFGSGSLVFVFYLTKIFSNSRASLIATILVSSNLFLIWQSSEIRPHSFVIFFSLLNVIFFFKLSELDSLRNRIISIFYIFISVIFLSSWPFALIIFFGKLLYLFHQFLINKKKNIFLFSCILISLIIYILLNYEYLIYHLSRDEHYTKLHLSFFYSYHFRSFFGSILGVWIFSRLVALGQIDTVISILYFTLLTSIGLIMLIESSQVIRDRVRRKTVKRKIHYHNWAHKLPFKIKFYKSKLYISAIPPIIIGFVIGILSATMGIGGTFILIPAMIYFLGMPTSKVIGTSLFQIIFVTALVTLLHATTTFAVDAVLAFFLIISSVIGAQVGVLAANKLRGEEIRALLAIIVLGVATKIALDLLVEPSEIFNISVIRALF